MAIQKTKVLSSGVSGNYWMIPSFYVSPDLSSVKVMSQLYTSAAAHVSGDAPIFSEELDLSGASNPLNSKKLINLIEQKLITEAGTDYLSGTIVP